MIKSRTFIVASLFIVFIILVNGYACKEFVKDKNAAKEVDFRSGEFKSPEQTALQDSNKSLKVAVSAIISPLESFRYYQELFNYISGKLHNSIEFKQRKTYAEVNQMLVNNEVDFAFICSGAYTLISDKVEILVVPVCNGKPFYQSYIIVNSQSGIRKFEDLRGKSFAFTDPLSNTGRLYAVKRLHDLNVTEKDFFSSTIYTHAHDISIQLVSKNVVDGAAVDGLIYQYQAKFHPETVKNIKIIEKSEDFGIPPVVVPRSLSPELKNRLRDIFLHIHQDSTGMKILNKLLIEKFIPGDDNNYNTIREMQKIVFP